MFLFQDKQILVLRTELKTYIIIIRILDLDITLSSEELIHPKNKDSTKNNLSLFVKRSITLTK